MILVFCCVSCGRSRDAAPVSGAGFSESAKQGDLALFIVGDYFSRYFISELVQLSKDISASGEPVFVCTQKYRDVLSRLLPANGVYNSRFVVEPEGSAIFKVWARDVAVAGKTGGGRVVVVSPDKHASTRREAEAAAAVMERVVNPGTEVRLAPFVFEGGNLVFVESDGRRVLIAGKKTIFDNDAYQKTPWADGLDEDGLLRSMKRTFGVDTVVVVGRADNPPTPRLYFEYHVDMGMTVLKHGRAVVSRLEFGEEDERALRRAIEAGDNVLSPYLGLGYGEDDLAGVLGRRLALVTAEYEDYAKLLEGLGLTVYRSQVTWKHVLAAMSWTNVVQTRDRVYVPLYPDSARGVTLAAEGADGLLSVAIDAASLENEQFLLEGENKLNRYLYGCMGYEAVPVPEYLHYYAGGIHRFVNILA